MGAHGLDRTSHARELACGCADRGQFLVVVNGPLPAGARMLEREGGGRPSSSRCAPRWTALARVLTPAGLLWIALLTGGCTEKDATPDALMMDFAVHADAFAAYHRWVRRAVFSAPEMAPEQLRTTLFSPLRLESGVAGAWVVRSAPLPIEAHLGEVVNVPTDIRWRRIRHSQYEPLELARAELRVRPENRMSGRKAEVLMVRVQLPDERTSLTVAYLMSPTP